jgi:hypothetical protein
MNDMFRTSCVAAVLALCGVLPVSAQGDPTSLEGYFTGKMVVAKIDMPGTEKGVDLAFNKPTPMDWNGYSSRLKDFGTAIHKGDAVRVTKIGLKSDHIEFQLDGGGFGVAGDDTNTTVAPVVTPISDREKDLVKQVAAAKDPKQKKDLQDTLDRVRAQRAQQDAANRNAAMIASQMKAQQVAAKRLAGGSRFNLRWQGSIPSDDKNPDTVMKLLADYVDFDPSHANAVPVVAATPTAAPAAISGAAGVTQLKSGMKTDDVTALLGQGQTKSQSVSTDGLTTQVIEYATADNLVDVTFVEGVVVRYSINSR